MRTKHKLFIGSLVILALGGMAACSKKSSPNEASSMTETKKLYHCPMHPQYTSDKPGECPICHMTLVLIDDHSESQTTPPDGSAVSGQGTVNIQNASAQQIGVNVSPVEKRDLFVSIKAPSRVAYDPNLYSAILEYQEALKSRNQGSAERQSEAQSTVRASKLRLRQMGLSDQQIADINRTGFDPSNLLLGKAGGKVWIYMDVYDYEASSVKSGQRAEFTTPAIPGQIFTGSVSAIDSIVNSETRTLRVRVEVPNLKGDLKPEMYLSGTIQASLGSKLAVPDSAVLDTGMRQLAYVQTGPGQFEPREIKVGREASDYYEVLSGLKEGEMVVTSANFFIDSESKIRAATKGK